MPSPSLIYYGFLFFALLASSCTTNRQYHPTGVAPAPEDGGKPGDGVKLSVVELDEQGDYWERRQMDLAVKKIRNSKKAPLVITYVHGWRHDAAPGDSDLAMFRTFIGELQAHQELAGKFEVHGVYVGWRGASARESKRLGDLNLLWAGPTFFGRRLQTERIARVPLTNTLLRLTQASRQHPFKGKSVIVGHSFGARVVEHAMAQAIVTQSALSSPGLELAMPADLIFLINQASESLTARQLKIALSNWDPKSPPAIVAMTSASDSATGGIWPIGLKLATALGAGGAMRSYPMAAPHRPDPQRSYYTTTTGHDARQISHRVYEMKAPQDGAVGEEGGGKGRGKFVLRFGRGPGASAEWELCKSSGNKGTTFVLDSDAYWVVELPKSVLDGHSGHEEEGGIFNGRMAELMTQLVKYAVPKAGRPSLLAPRPATAEDASNFMMQGELAPPAQ